MGFSAIHRKDVRPKVKYAVIYRHRHEYPISVMCKFFEVSRSGYYDFVKRLGQPGRDAELAKKIQECQDKTDKTHGYRRVWKWLKDGNIKKNPKTVLRIMKKYGLLSEIRRRRKWVNLGQQIHRYENLLKRQFRADRPNTKWVTDNSNIHTKEVVLYLSIIRDLYDNSIVCIQDGNTVNGELFPGHDPAGDDEREKESRCGVTTPQRPGLSIYVTSVF